MPAYLRDTAGSHTLLDDGSRRDDYWHKRKAATRSYLRASLHRSVLSHLFPYYVSQKRSGRSQFLGRSITIVRASLSGEHNCILRYR
jgi:hypothetical protein